MKYLSLDSELNQIDERTFYEALLVWQGTKFGSECVALLVRLPIGE